MTDLDDRRGLLYIGLLLFAGAYGLAPYVYASYGNNYFFNTVITYYHPGLLQELAHVATDSYYPPLYFWLESLIVHAFDLTIVGATMIMVPLVLLTALYLFHLGKLLFGRPAGLLAALVFLLLPGTAMATSSTVRDAPLALFAVATIYHLLRSDGLRRPLQGLIAGIFFGAGMLTKWTFPVYLAGLAPLILAEMIRPGLIGLVRLDRDFAPADKSFWKGLLVFVLTAVLVCGWWYFFYLDLETLQKTSHNDPSFPVRNGYAFGPMFAYCLKLFCATQLRWLWLVPAVIGLLVSLAGKNFRYPALSLFLAVGIGIIFLAVPHHTEERYYYPLLPWVALLAASAANIFKRKSLIRGWSVLLIVLGLIGYIDTFFAGRFWPGQSNEEALACCCDEYQVKGRLPWMTDRGSKKLMRMIDDYHRTNYGDRASVLVVNRYNPYRCQIEPHVLQLVRQGARPSPMEISGYGEYNWHQTLTYRLKQGDLFYFVIRETVSDNLADLNREAVHFIDIASGNPKQEATFDQKMELRQKVKSRLKRIGAVTMPLLGDVGVYVHPPGTKDFMD